MVCRGVDMCIDICSDVCIGLCINMRIDMYADMCIDMYMNVCVVVGVPHDDGGTIEHISYGILVMAY